MISRLNCVELINSQYKLGYSDAYIESYAYAQYGKKVGLQFIKDYMALIRWQTIKSLYNNYIANQLGELNG